MLSWSWISGPLAQVAGPVSATWKRTPLLPFRRELVFEPELEPVVEVVGDDVAGVVRIGADEDAFLHLPAGLDGVGSGAEVMPALGGLAVEERAPAFGFLARA